MKIKEKFRVPLMLLTVPVFALNMFIFSSCAFPVENKDAVRLTEINLQFRRINNYINDDLGIKIGNLQDHSNLDSLLQDKNLMNHPDFSTLKSEVNLYRRVKNEHDSLAAIPGIAELAEKHESHYNFVNSFYAPFVTLGIGVVSSVPAALGLFLPVYDDKKRK